MLSIFIDGSLFFFFFEASTRNSDPYTYVGLCTSPIKLFHFIVGAVAVVAGENEFAI